MKVVLHICCAVCAAGAADTLISEGHQVLGFFFNPNIHPAEEYHRRLEATRRVAANLGFTLFEGDYNPESWFEITEVYKDEPEGGKRCPICFEQRLKATYRFMLDTGCEAFSSTLTVGPRKPAAVIQRSGDIIGGERFLFRDFKKKDGFKKAITLSNRWGLYRQNYCGCIYSLRERSRL